MSERCDAMTRRIAIALVLATFAVFSSASQALECQIVPGAASAPEASGNDALHALPHRLDAAPHTDTHGQLLVGDETLYTVHLPVFMSQPEAHPHNFQVIAEVAFADPEHRARYRADRAEHDGEIYTAVPPPFDQTALVLEHEGRAPLRTLPGVTVMRGHFEQGGELIIDGATLEIVRLVEFRELDPAAERASTPMYRLYGRGGEIFLTHMLSGPPDRDETVRVSLKVAGKVPAVLEDDVARASEDAVVILGGAEGNLEDRLREGDALPCRIVPTKPTRALPVEATLVIEEELYCELGELSAVVTDTFNTPERCS